MRFIGSGSAGEVLGERRPFDELHHERADPIGDFETVNRRDVRVVQRRQQTGLSLQPRNPFGVEESAAGRTFTATSRASRVSRAR